MLQQDQATRKPVVEEPVVTEDAEITDEALASAPAATLRKVFSNREARLKAEIAQLVDARDKDWDGRLKMLTDPERSKLAPIVAQLEGSVPAFKDLSPDDQVGMVEAIAKLVAGGSAAQDGARSGGMPPPIAPTTGVSAISRKDAVAERKAKAKAEADRVFGPITGSSPIRPTLHW
jgi:hypothetical protein